MTMDIYQSSLSRERNQVTDRVAAPPVGPAPRSNNTRVMSSNVGGGKKSGLSSSTATGRVPLQSRNPNTISGSYRSSSSHNTTEEYNSKDILSMNRLSKLESSHNENNKRLTNSTNNSSNFHHPQQQQSGNVLTKPQRSMSATELREGAESASSSNIPSAVRPGYTKRSNSAPINVANLDEDSVIIEEKRRKVNGEGYTLHRYLRGKMLGKGGFAKVYLCTALDTNKAYAIKIVSKANLVKARARQKLQAEIKIHRTLRHKHVCEYKHFFEDRTNCYILLELCHNQSMNEMIKRRKRLTEPETAYLMIQLLLATKYMHEQLVIHRDLKLGNLFLDRNMNMKVGDLGLATKLESADEKRKTICGTPNYIAPEVIQGDRATRGHSFEVDIWSMGVIMYTCLVGKPPYEAKDVKATYQRIIKNEYSFPRNLAISDDAKDMIVSMLQSKPLDRPTLQEMSCHPFLTANFVPDSLPSNATHIAPKWGANNESYSTNNRCNSGQQKTVGRPAIPKSNSHSLRQPFGARNPNVDNRVEKKLTGKVVKETVPTTSTVNSSPIMDVQGAVKNAWSAVVNATTATPPPQSTCSSKFQVFDETSNNKPPNSDIVSRTANLGLQSQQDASPSTTVKPSPRVVTPNMDAYILNNMVDRVSIVLDIVSSRDYSNVAIGSPSLVPVLKGGPVKWVDRYVDYTSKYGLGYLLSDGSSGVYFNDSTKTVLEANGEEFQYIERKRNAEESPRRSEPVIASHTLANYPDKLQKKVTLLKHFRNYLIDQQQKSDEGGLPILSAAKNNTEINVGRNMVFLKKWVRTKHAIFFRLSDQTVQIVFYDHTEVLLTSDERFITYVDKSKNRNTYFMTDELVGCNAEITKRLKYTKEILLQLVGGGVKTLEMK